MVMVGYRRFLTAVLVMGAIVVVFFEELVDSQVRPNPNEVTVVLGIVTWAPRPWFWAFPCLGLSMYL